jgi:hypothetical protein
MSAMTTVATDPSTAALPLPVTPREEYLFDLQGYLVLRGAVTPEHVDQMNRVIDGYTAMTPPLKHGEWVGAVLAHTYTGAEGMNLQQVYEAGEPFERLIDHPAWIDKVTHFVGGQTDFDAHHGPLFIDEAFASIRGPGDFIGLHSGGHKRVKRCQFRYHNGQFHCGQVNILLALTDIGPGDGGTMLVPGSHKANFQHHQFNEKSMAQASNGSGAEGTEAAIEVHMRRGDALLFVDAISHGSAVRRNAGQRRIVVYRYGPSWGTFRHPVYPSDELMARLTPRRAKIVLPQRPARREPNRIAGYPSPGLAST